MGTKGKERFRIVDQVDMGSEVWRPPDLFECWIGRELISRLFLQVAQLEKK